MKRVVSYVVFFVVVIVSWVVFAQQQKTQSTVVPAQVTASIESQPGTSVGR